jgi:hypothetical protein
MRLTDPQLVANRARWDADARVREAAVGKLADPGLLEEIARSDPEEPVRAAALARSAQTTSAPEPGSTG